jgi:hypothetical protein
MNPAGAIVIYVLIWWSVFFAVLPWGVRGRWESDDDGVKGADPGAGGAAAWPQSADHDRDRDRPVGRRRPHHHERRDRFPGLAAALGNNAAGRPPPPY